MLTSKQEAYKNARLAGNDPSLAYKLVYDAHNMSDHSIAKEAYELDVHPAIAPLIKAGRERIEAQLAERIVWDRSKLVDEFATNATLAREAKQFGPSNRALELIGKTEGLLDEKRQDERPTITKVVVVLNDGKSEEHHMIEAPYTVEEPSKTPSPNDESEGLTEGSHSSPDQRAWEAQ